jgi:hypothetical protein
MPRRDLKVLVKHGAEITQSLANSDVLSKLNQRAAETLLLRVGRADKTFALRFVIPIILNTFHSVLLSFWGLYGFMHCNFSELRFLFCLHI